MVCTSIMMANLNISFRLSSIISTSLFTGASLFLIFFNPLGTHFSEEYSSIEISRRAWVALQPLQSEGLFVESHMVEDVVIFPDYVMLFIVSYCSKSCSLARIYEYDSCLFGADTRTPIISMEDKETGLIVAKCLHPKLRTNASGSVTLAMKSMDEKLISQAYYSGNHSWDSMVYEILSLSNKVVLFVKGSSFRRGRTFDSSKLACIYGGYARTKVLHAAQEVVQCERPLPAMEESVAGAKVSIWEAHKMGSLMPSVVRFNPKVSFNEKPSYRYSLCVCSMVWNQASFLKEWVMYHGWLGVERWFLYDNNSDDNIEEVVKYLSNYNVSRHIWPWIKTQEAGFSHCAIRAGAECTWAMFIDVDEFVYPKYYIEEGLKEGSIMKRVFQNVSNDVGELRINCLNFGPSGLSQSPKEGVTVGYTCRMHAPERHKSIVKLEALNGSLLNVVHHFDLKSEFKHMDMPMKSVVINHYKYQVWEVFKRKFVRRVATYVTDWGEKQNESSKDRTPGLGTEAIEPSDWKHRFCEVNDSGLKNLVLQIFAKDISDQRSLECKWQK